MLVHIVDDSSINCEILATIVGRLDPTLRVVSFVDPLAGFEACKGLLPDLIVVDYMMPGLDGHDYVARVRALPGAKTVPIVMITAVTDRAIRHRALELGVTDFLTKPIDKQEIKARLTNLLALRRAHIALQDRSRWLAEEVRKATEKVLHQANHDALTELPNRAFFRDKVDRLLVHAARAEEQVAVLYLDLDGFKRVNDTGGHAMGDDVLRRVGAALRDGLAPGETAARLGGDEFAIVQSGAPQPAGAAAVAERVIASIARCCEVWPHAEIGVSIGIAIYPTERGDVEEMMQYADIALYRAKHEARGGFRFFEPAMDAQLRDRRALERDLREAMSAGALDVHYQPQADAATGRIVGFEALARWSHPERGIVPPLAFIEVAEECGFIRPLGEWVLRKACAEATTWPSDLRLGVNLSPLQVRPELPELVRGILADTGFAAHRLELEITEGVLIKDAINAVAVLSELKAMGVAIALDDFGTGYSSLSYLQKFPFDRVKIDRSFVSELLLMPEAEAIIRAIVALTRSLCISSIAEGVETVQQLDALRRESCQEVQGFLIGRPMPAADVATFVQTHRPEQFHLTSAHTPRPGGR